MPPDKKSFIDFAESIVNEISDAGRFVFDSPLKTVLLLFCNAPFTKEPARPVAYEMEAAFAVSEATQSVASFMSFSPL